MSASKGGGFLRLLQLLSGLVLFAGLYGLMTGAPWSVAALLFGGLGWLGFKMLAWVFHG